MAVKKKILPPNIVASIEKFSHDGRGIARINGKTTFIEGALPGEEVIFQYTRVKSDYDEGKVLSISVESPLRAIPKCPHFEICGGCSLQHIKDQAQIQIKQDLLLDSLQRIGHVQPKRVLAALESSSWNYRTKARLSVRYVNKKSATLIGFREKENPRYIAEIGQCPILHSKVDNNLGDLRKLLDTLDAPESIAQIEVAAGDEQVALIFRHLSPFSTEDGEKLQAFAKMHDYILLLQPGKLDSIHCVYPPNQEPYLSYSLPSVGIKFKFHPNDFTQVNSGINRQMVTQVLSLLSLTKEDVVLDLFCGLGNFSLPLAKLCRKVIGVEGSESMVLRAQMNAKLNQIDNAYFYSANLENIEELLKLNLREVTKLLIDPPRSGAEVLVKNIDKLSYPKTIVYVSCNPATLSRDSDILVNQHGYQLIAAGVMDMFPHTAHVESLALFERS